MNARTIAHVVVAAVVTVVGSSFVQGCAVAPASEDTGSESSAMIKLGGGGSGGGGVAGIDGSTCNQSTTCCTGGTPGWMTNPGTSSPEYAAYIFEQAAISLGCNNLLVVGTNGTGHYWFTVTCPYNSSIAPWVDALVNGGAGADTEAREYQESIPCVPAPPVGEITLDFDPTCPTGCLVKP